MAFMDDVHQSFCDALEEEGLDAEVKHYTDSKLNHMFKVRKHVNGSPVTCEAQISERTLMDDDMRAQEIAFRARHVVQSFNEYLTEHIEWGEHSVKVDMKGDEEATCYRCGAEVSLSSLDFTTPMHSETAVPHPPMEVNSLPDVKIRMTLLALLRDECEEWCPNSAYDRKI